MPVRNLKDELVKVAAEAAMGEKQDHRFKPWAKEVTEVDPRGQNGYAFKGDFVADGTVDVSNALRVYLVMTSSGSSKYQTQYYSCVVMNADGSLEPGGFHTTNKTKGWAVRIRDQVTELVTAHLGQEVEGALIGFGDDELIAELKRRGYSVAREDN